MTTKTLENLVNYAISVRNTQWYREFKNIYDNNHYCVSSKYLKTIPETYLQRLKDSTPSYYDGKKYYICDRDELAILRHQTLKIHNDCIVCGASTKNALFCSSSCRAKHKSGQLSFLYKMVHEPRVNKKLRTWAKGLTHDKTYKEFCRLYDTDVQGAKNFILNTHIAQGLMRHTLSPYMIPTDINSWYLGDLVALRHPYRNNVCKVCGKPTGFNRKEVNFNLTCSKKCAWEISQDDRKKTNLAKYGFEYSMQNEEVKNKVTETTILNFGVKRPAQNKAIKERIKRTRQLRSNNGEYDQTRQMVTQQINREKRVLLNTGKRYDYKDARGKTHSGLQGYEPIALQFLDTYKNIKHIESKISKVTEKGIKYYDRASKKRRTYFPDFKVTGKNKTYLVEVKSLGTLDLDLITNICKFRQATKYCNERGWDYLVLIHKYDTDLEPIRIINPMKLKDLCVSGIKIAQRCKPGMRYGRVSYTYERNAIIRTGK
jgi:predicted nucleic acid-binding Zn ribbon protein